MFKFLCDEMLTGLGRWLRIAGYDTWIVEPGAKDHDIAVLVKSSQRWFLTCDVDFVDLLKDQPSIIWFENSNITQCVKKLNRTLNINWLDHAFVRCSVCNTPLRPAHVNQVRKLDIELETLQQPIVYCAQCDKLYWEGSHVKRMRSKLAEFQRLRE